MDEFRLGLIGASIGRSQAPWLHKKAGQLCGLQIHYKLFDLNELSDKDLKTLLDRLIAQGFHGVNITHPVKEQVTRFVDIPDEAMRRIGAVNTLCFADRTAYNTDYSGFIKAFQKKFGTVTPGKVLMLGAGGVGKAIAFALLHLDVNTELSIVDTNLQKSSHLANELKSAGLRANAYETNLIAELSKVDGLINCTPLGMYQYPGCALPKHLFGGQSWAFDAVYTPLKTEFLQCAQKANLETLSGYELFFYQGRDAFELFTGHQVDEAALRKALAYP